MVIFSKCCMSYLQCSLSISESIALRLALRLTNKYLYCGADIYCGTIASNTEGFSGADLQALLSDAQLESVHQHLERETNGSSNKPIITNTILESVLAKARPSVSENERNSFMQFTANSRVLEHLQQPRQENQRERNQHWLDIEITLLGLHHTDKV
eukprot:TRINITY_DN3444_c0_g1_i6.p1 TRINITY_DN3444_c0_g1~~TRINITY_DN3444_c0_g1_i6.p1  ORF type:complete len:156 (+),score=25.83 TRINITY_DN3444_c0_g1_i6:604-1071(+)